MTPFWMLLGARLHGVEHAVDAVAHPDVVLGRLDVDVGGVVLDRLADQQVHEPDDRRVVVGRLGEPTASSLAAFSSSSVEVRSLSSSSARMYRSIAAEQVGLFGDGGRDAEPGGGAHVVDGEDVAGVGHRQDDHAVGGADRQHGVAAADRAGDERDGRAVDGVVGQFDERDAGLGRSGAGQLRLT